MSIQALIFYILFSIIKTDSRDYLKDSIEKQNRRMLHAEGQVENLSSEVK